MKHNYIGFARTGNVFGPATGEGEYFSKLPSGHYKIDYVDYRDQLMLTKFTPRTDEILNLGCKEFNEVISVANKFLSPETAEKFAKNGFLLKRSWMFYGPPGTGKSVLSCKVSEIAVQAKDALALYPSSYEALERMLEVLDDTDKDRFKVIVLEEFDDLVSGHDESSWTTLLDGQFQSPNRILLATTNYIEAVPQRLLRPGRFSSLVHIPTLMPHEREKFLLSKGVETKLAKTIAEKTHEFTIDELKEVVQSHVVLGENLDSVLNALSAARNLGKDDE